MSTDIYFLPQILCPTKNSKTAQTGGLSFLAAPT